MFVSELFANEGEDDLTQIQVATLDHVPHKYAGVIGRLAKFHHVNLENKNGKWFAAPTDNLNPFLNDVKHITSAAGMGAMHEDMQSHGALKAICYADNIHKIYVFGTNEPNVFELEDGSTHKNKTVRCSLNQIKQMLPQRGYKNIFTVDDDDGLDHDIDVDEAAMTKSVPKKSESTINSRMEKPVALLKAWQEQRDQAIRINKKYPPRPDIDVVVKTVDRPDEIGYGKLILIGETGLFKVQLNGPELPEWAEGRNISVRPCEVYSIWDNAAALGKTVRNREYDDVGRKIKRT